VRFNLAPDFFIMFIYLQEGEQLRVFNNQIEEDRKIIISRHNLVELHKVWTQGFCPYLIPAYGFLHVSCRIYTFYYVLSVNDE
jgi:hypothetical protein